MKNSKYFSVLDVRVFDSEFGERLGDLLDFQVKDFNDALFEYLGIDYAGLKWDHVISQQMWRLSSYGLNSPPLHLRAQAINSLLLSRVIYRDFTCPMPESTMQKLDRLIQKKVSSTAFPSTGRMVP